MCAQNPLSKNFLKPNRCHHLAKVSPSGQKVKWNLECIKNNNSIEVQKRYSNSSPILKFYSFIMRQNYLQKLTHLSNIIKYCTACTAYKLVRIKMLSCSTVHDEWQIIDWDIIYINDHYRSISHFILFLLLFLYSFLHFWLYNDPML